MKNWYLGNAPVAVCFWGGWEPHTSKLSMSEKISIYEGFGFEEK